MERKLAAILAGDIVGYSRLMANNETATYSKLRAVFDEIIKPAIERRSGRIFKSAGDGFMACFASANEALEAALDIQDAFEDRPLKLRMGLNLGDVIEENGDVFGDGVNIAARLEAMAEQGSIYISEGLMRSTNGIDRAKPERLGRRRLKNIPESVEIYAIRSRRSASVWRFRREGAIAASLLAAALLVSGGWWGYQSGWHSTAAQWLGVAQLASSQASDGRPVVAVLPFNNLSNDPGQDYFADGLTEDIITDLARNRELLVIARNSTFAFKDRAIDIRAVGSELGAQYVVEGSARRVDDKLRVVAQLIDSRSGAHLWSRSYDRRVEDVFEVQNDLTGLIVASLLSYVRQSETAAANVRPTENARAYDLVLQARSLFQHGSKNRDGLLAARALYERAIALDPQYAAAHAYLAVTYVADFVQDITGEAKTQDLQKGLAEAQQAAQLEPDSALAYQVLSFALSASTDFEGGLKAAQRAIELSPNDPDSLMALAKAQVRFGAYEDAVANAERARRLHPLAPAYYHAIHGQALYATERLDEADQVLSQCLLNAPQEPNCLRIHAATLARLGRVDEARDRIARLAQVEPNFSLAAEMQYRRFGASALMERYLQDLTAAGVGKAAGQSTASTLRPA